MKETSVADRKWAKGETVHNELKKQPENQEVQDITGIVKALVFILREMGSHRSILRKDKLKDIICWLTISFQK